MKRLKRLFQQWRESWADAAYDDIREELVRMQFVQTANRQAIERLTAQVKALSERAKV